MTRDPKQTQTMEEPASEQALAMRTTLVQPIPLSRHPDFVRTHYWEKLSGEAEEPKRSAASYASAGQTVVGLGPDDPIVQAVHAAKQQLLEAERAHQERTSHERPRVAEVARADSASTAKTVLMPALDVMQLMASRVRSANTDEPVQLPKRKLKPFLIAGAALAVIACVATASHFTSASTPEESFVKPRPQAQQSATITPAPAPPPTIKAAPAAASVNTAPSQAPQAQVTEKAAVDALFAGDYVLAGSHYATLASAHPEQPAFAEAARILKRNARPDAK
jgi:hypothetical protein